MCDVVVFSAKASASTSTWPRSILPPSPARSTMSCESPDDSDMVYAVLIDESAKPTAEHTQGSAGVSD